MTNRTTPQLGLQLATHMAGATEPEAAARVLVDWLERTTGATWWVLAVLDDTTTTVVAGPGTGSRVPWARTTPASVPSSMPGDGADDQLVVRPVVTRFDTWGAVATTHLGPDMVDGAARALAAAVEALQGQDDLRSAIDRLEEAQEVAHMGSYDWDIRTDTNIWSDELYRIYGHEPQAFNASYERFLSMVHPDDRALVQEIHQQAYATGEPYHTTERIVRPSGEVRVLDTTGRVIHDAAGTPVRMAGICIDITERWHSEQETERVGERFRLLLEAAPDALLVIGPDQAVAQVNARATELFRADADTLVGTPLCDLLPDAPPVVDSSQRTTTPEQRAVRQDGSAFPADVTFAVLEDGDAPMIAAFVSDATGRLQEEQRRQASHDADLRHRQALEINDNVLQGLTACIYTLEHGDTELGTTMARTTLQSARRMVHDLLATSHASQVAPGSLVRDLPAPSAGVGGPEPHHAAVAGGDAGPGTPSATVRVLVVDDSQDLRLLLRLALEAAPGFEVVGEAGDGRAAVDAALDLQPDLVLLDLSMPVMDGLQALPLVRSAAPEAAVVVLSGFDHRVAADEVVAAGAAAYLEKGTPQVDLVARLRELTGAPDRQGAVLPQGAPGPLVDASNEALSHLVHEFATPLTAVEGLAETLLLHADRLTSATAAEVMASLHRNVRTLSELLRRVSDAHHVDGEEVSRHPDDVNLAAVVAETVTDLSRALGERRVTIEPRDGEQSVLAHADPVHVRQVVTNLLSNAIKFSPPGSHIRVAIRATDEIVEVDVVDQGSGVPAERSEDLFERFVRGNTGVPGLGLGLFLARRFARANNGDVSLVATGDDGSTFRLTLPTARVREPGPGRQLPT